MKYMKKILGLVLALCLMAGFAVPTHAAEQSEVLQVLALLGVMNGDENGNLNLSGSVTRAQFAKMCIAASPLKEQGKYPSGLAPFPDVAADHWAAGYIAAARDAGWFFGDLSGNFRPNDGVTLAEAATVALRMLGYTNSDFSGRWPSGQMRLYDSLELDEDISAGQDTKLTRMACGQLIYNTLCAPTKTGSAYCTTMGYPLNSQGKIDSLALMSAKLEGPVILEGSLAGSVGFTPRKIYVNGKEGVAAEAVPYSVVYHQAETATVFVYTTRHTGTISAISPSADAPSAVTVGGITYSLGTSRAAVSLSSQGQFHVGDRVTLLMGRSGQVAAVMDGDELSQTIYGVVSALTKTTYAGADGNRYDAGALNIITTDGSTCQHEADVEDFEVGDLVSVDYSASGRAVKKLSEKSISGKVSKNTIGSYELSDDVEILDVWEGSAAPVSVERLRDCTLSSSDVRYVAYDSNGEVSHLILDDYTGDIHSYGLLTDHVTIPTGTMSFVSYYTFLLYGEETTMPFENISFSVEDGGLELRMEDGVPTELHDLERVSVRTTGGTWISNNSQRCTLADNVQVYVKQGDNWYLGNWDQVNDTEKYTLAAWYDAEDNDGGRVRVITANAK